MLEQLAMYMTSLPCPPLPIMLPGETEAKTSHDLLAGLLTMAMMRGGSEKLNETRKQKQIQITRTMLDKCLASDNADQMYAICQEFTAEYLHAFDDAGQCTPGVCFLSMDDVQKGDKTHAAACSWHAAQDILHSPAAEQRKASQFAALDYGGLIELHWLRVRDAPTTTLPA